MSTTYPIGRERGSLIEEYLQQGNYDKAFDRCEAILIASSSTEELQVVCDSIEQLLPKLNFQKKEAIVQETCKKLAHFPSLRDLQVKFLCHFGDVSMQKDQSFSSLIVSIRSYATAYILKPELFVDERLQRAFFYVMLDSFQYQLQQTAGRGDIPLFTSLLMLKVQTLHQRFSQNAEDIQIFYQRARKVYQELNPTSREKFSVVLSIIEEGEKKVVPLDVNQQTITSSYRDSLQTIRLNYNQQLETREFQKKRAEEYRAFFSMLFDDAILMLGRPPGRYDIRITGSVAREENCPFSDFEYFIVIENPANFTYFRKLAQIFELQIISLGETDPKHQGIFDFGQKTGLEVDHQSNPAYHDPLIGTLESLFTLTADPTPDDLKAYKSHLCSVSLKSNFNFQFPQLHLEEYFETLLKMRRSDFNNLHFLQGDESDIKKEFMEPLFHFLSDLGRSMRLEEMNTLDIIERLPQFDALSKSNLKFAVAYLYNFRIGLHQSYGGIIENVALKSSLGLPTIQEKDKETLKWILNWVLTPLYQADLSEKDIDLMGITFSKANPTIVRETAHFLRESPLDVHLYYYQRLNMPNQKVLQEQYLKSVPQYAKSLASIPNRAGYRQSRRLEEAQFTSSLRKILTDNPESGVKVSSYLFGEAYLTREASMQLIDSKGHIRPMYGNSLHRVSYFKDFHFKELPFQPLMEYAVRSLIHRIMGQATPTTTLVRIQIPAKKLSYPLLISQTITGQELHPSVNLNLEHLTWLLLCEILTKPGDGRPSNYIVRFGKVYCVDNDISLMKPVKKNKLGQNKPVFCSSLFTLNHPLNQHVLKQFCDLEPDLILRDWLIELQMQERKYLGLFPNPQELKFYYEQDAKRSFSPKLLLPKGTIASLIMQFQHLQNVLRLKHFPDACSLLGELVTSDGRIGALIEKHYRNALSQPFERRLKVAIHTSVENSLTSEQAMKMSLDSVPTFSQIQKEKTYSLREAFTELCLFETQKQNKAFSLDQNMEDFTLEADLEQVTDPEREAHMFRAFQLLFEAQRQKPRVLALKHTTSLTISVLEPLLHPDLRSLDLSHGKNVSNKIVELIEKKCPSLESLSLEGCTLLDQFSVNLPNLQFLNLKGCSQISRLYISSPHLRQLEITELPKNPLDCFALGVRYAKGLGVEKNPAQSLKLWQYAASKNYGQAQEVMKWLDQISETSNTMETYGVKDKQIEAFSYALLIKPSVSTIVFRNGKISDLGASFISEILKDNPNITSINLLQNKIGPSGAHRLSEALKVTRNLKTLILDDNPIGLLGAQNFAKALEENTTLQKLSLAGCEIGDDGVGAIAQSLQKNTSLINLILKNNKISASGAIHLSKSLIVNSSLRYLDLSQNRVGPNGGKTLARSLESNKGLTLFYLTNGDIGLVGGQAFAQMLGVNRTLLDLSLRENNIGSGAVTIANALVGNNTLRKLNLMYNSIRDAGGEAFGKLLRNNRTLTLLYLGGNSIGPEGGIGIAEGLRENQGLVRLQICDNHIKDEGAKAFATTLEVNKTLCAIELDKNEILRDGALALARAFSCNKTLVELVFITDHFMETNVIRHHEFKALRDALQVNFNLCKLEIYASTHRVGVSTFEKGEILTVSKPIVKEIYQLIQRNEKLGLSALQQAINGSEELLDLLDQGVSLYFSDSAGNTALHFCAGHGHVELMKKLLKRSPNMAIENSNYQTPLAIAKERGKREIVALLS